MANSDGVADLSSAGKSERFQLRRRIGSGAMGMVYEAFDCERGAVVALKILHRVDPEALFQFKAEFRTLSNLTHRNLLQLFELSTREDDYVLSMELVDGEDFLSHVRSRGEQTFESELDEDTLASDLTAARRESSPESDVRSSKKPSTPGATRRLAGLDEDKLRRALRELAEGLQALHRSGHLHRDLKPANVLVFRRDERVVLCDFGLVVETRTQHHAPSARSSNEDASPQQTSQPTMSKTGATGSKIAGSLAFMSPEQSLGSPLGRATDWYSVGVMLYQALTGVVPLDARLGFAEAVLAKQSQVPLHPRLLSPSAPADLADLTMALLAHDPQQRAGYHEVLSTLDQSHAPGSTATLSLPPEVLIGRDEQLRQLEAALASAKAGRATVAFVSGHSGMGKSAIVRRFLTRSEQEHGALVLRARCYECEELPYKVFDPLVDALSQHLLTLEHDELARLLPEDTCWLATLFPALRRVRAVRQLADAPDLPDPFERKRRAFGAFRELCLRLAATRPVILYIDDLQWGDLDSGGPLFELLREPHAPPVLLIGAYRAEDRERSPLLRDLRVHLPLVGLAQIARVEVGSLDDDDARSLAATLLFQHPNAQAAVERVVKEAAGSPFFVRELASYLSTRTLDEVHELRLETVIQAHIETLPIESRTLLDVLAVAGRPETRDVVQRASQLGARMFATTQALESQNLLASAGTRASDKLEPYHDRIRETLYRALGEERRRFVHRLLAEALEKSADSLGVARDAEALFGHFRNAQDRARAGHYAVIAAERAQAALAFVRAAALYREAVDLLDDDPARTSQLEEKLGTALMFSGRGAEAADAFLRAMSHASSERATDLRALAMTQLLGSGHLGRAFEELVRAQDALGLTFPRSNLRAIVMLLLRKLRMRLDDESIRVLPVTSIDEAALRRVDDLYKVSVVLSTVDFLRGGAYTAECTLRALRTGDASRLACALAIEGARSAGENKKPARTQWMIERGAELARVSGELYPVAATRGTAGVARYLEGRFREAVQLTRESQQIHHELLKRTHAWDYWVVVLFELRAAAELGDLQALIKRVPETIRDAEERGDLYVKNMARVAHLTWAWLAPDQLALAREQVALAEREWVQDGYQLMHHYRLISRTEIALYDGSREACEAAWLDLRAAWKPMSLVRKIQTCRVQALYMRARVALALAKTRPELELLKSARADAAALRKEGVAWADALGQLLQGCIASFDAPAVALALLQPAQHAFETEQLALYAAATRKLIARITVDDAGAGAADATLRALGVVAPDSFVRMLAPSAGDRPLGRGFSGVRAKAAG